MTREEAKRTLQDMWECLFNEMTNHTFEDLKEHGMLDNYSMAFDMAISALSENKGEWIHVVDSYYKDGREKESHWECSKCGSRKSWWGEFKFCPTCGADMRGET